MRIKATACKGKDLLPGDLFSTANQYYWDTIKDRFSIGERVYIRTETPSNVTTDAEAIIYKIEIIKE